MKLACWFIFATFLPAAEVSDRHQIRQAVAALNHEIAALPDPHPWSETTRPRFRIARITFAAPDLALVDGSFRQYGSMILVRSLPARLVLRRVEGSWKLVAMYPGNCLPPGVECRCPCPCEP